MFWIIAGLLSVIVTAWLLVPLLRAQRSTASRAIYDINVYKDQLTELDRDVALGRIAGNEADAARLEIQRRLLAAGDEAEAPARQPVRAGNVPVIIAAIMVPALALVFYYETGSPSVPDFPLAERTDIKTPARVTDEQTTMRDLAGQLEERLRQNPGDAKGWVLLAKTYATIGDARKAAAAYARATTLTERNPEVLADWAEARLMALGGGFTPEIFADFLEARDRDPILPKPWFYIGLDKAMGGDLEGAAQTWTDLLAITPKGAPFAEAVRAQIARAAEEGGFKPSDIKPSEAALALAKGNASSLPSDAPTSAKAGPVPPGPSQQDIDAAGQMTDEERTAFIRTMVERLAAKLEENPADRAGWERLIRAYDVLGETDKAAAAKARLEALPAN